MTGMALFTSRAVTSVAALFLCSGRYEEYEQYGQTDPVHVWVTLFPPLEPNR